MPAKFLDPRCPSAVESSGTHRHPQKGRMVNHQNNRRGRGIECNEVKGQEEGAIPHAVWVIIAPSRFPVEGRAGSMSVMSVILSLCLGRLLANPWFRPSIAVQDRCAL